MNREINKIRQSKQGQTALILILLTAAALIFLAITLNWGRIAQEKSMLSMAADEAATLLASDAASYGESQKQTYLNDTNNKTESTGLIIAIFAVIVAIAVLIYTSGTGLALATHALLMAIAWASVAMSVANLVLQSAVIQPGISHAWNNLQKDQPVQQQFYEQGMAAALQGAVTDQVNITDYTDLNANGIMGTTGGQPNDVIGRFGLFYTDRLKMLNQDYIPQVSFFYSQLSEFVNGQTCAQNYEDHNTYPKSIPLNPSCIDPGTGSDYCPGSANAFCPTGGFCETNLLQHNNNPTTYPLDPSCINPTTQIDYCLSDPACQQTIPNLISCTQNAYEHSQDSTIPLNPVCPTDCLTTPSDPACELQVPNTFSFQLNDACTDSIPGSADYNPYCDPCCQPLSVKDGSQVTRIRPSNCDQSVVPAQCLVNNPYVSRPFLYDPTYQEYANGISFLDQMGRDQQEGPFTALTSEPQGNPSNQLVFPNGIYPFFWLMKDYSPEVDNLDPTAGTLAPAQVHWCAAAGAALTPPVGFSDLTPLGQTPYNLPYTCQGKDCCVNYLANGFVVSNGATIPSFSGTTNGAIDMVGSLNPALDKGFGLEGQPWLEGDNQLCSGDWPYNGSGTAESSDGTCEWTNDTTPLSSHPTIGKESTIDAMDNTMHLLSDFTRFANGIFSGDVGSVSSNFNTWYAQAADWIDPASNGRLLNIYEPEGYPNISGYGSNYTGSTIDQPKTWIKTITDWLSTNYTPVSSPYPWCVPPVSTSTGLEVAENGRTVSTNEESFIQSNSGTPSWGDLPHVIACLNYNAGPSPAQTGMSNYTQYKNCLATLNSNVCAQVYSTNLPPQCAALGLPPNRAAGTAPAYDGCTGKYAAWVNSSINFGPVYNYQACLNLLNSSCPSSLSNTVCDPAILGRSLMPAYTGCADGTACNGGTCGDTAHTKCVDSYHGGSSCNVSGSNPDNYTYAKWIQDNLTLFTDESPKFAVRLAFLSDVYSRAQIMQNIFQEQDQALHIFFKTCDSSDSACQSGGPAAQLIYAKVHPAGMATLPNSVIYGWVDNAPVGGSGGCYSGNARVGCAHIVKVTAFAPGRNGNCVDSSLCSTVPFVATKLPWIHTSTSSFIGIPTSRSYTLTDRDGYVYISVRRWDQNHTSPVTFPNGRPVWQFSSNNPSTGAAGSGLPPSCIGIANSSGQNFGYGLVPQTVTGLTTVSTLLPQDKASLSRAFMINSGASDTTPVDPNATSGQYATCIQAANTLLSTGMESHACARYIASNNASNDNSGDSDNDYTLKFVDCNTIDGGKPPKSSP